MVNRQHIYISLAISAGVCASIGLYLLHRHQRKIATNRSATPTTIRSSLNSHREYQYFDRCSSSEMDNDESESLQISNEIKIPDGGVPLTPDQASILTRFLYESNDDEEQLHYALASITNASMFKESQINLANAGCILRLRELLLKTDNDITKCKVLLALNNLALNDFAITQFSNIVPIVIHLCRISLSNSDVRLYGLNLLINMSVLEYLHEEYMSNIYELGLLVESTIEYEDEALSAGKILVNLSTNKSNLGNLLKITGVELKKILNLFTSKIDPSSKSEDVLLRYLTFYCNLADIILYELKEGEDRNTNYYSWLNNPTSFRRGAVYFEFFDQDKQQLAKSLLRPHYTSNLINSQMKRLFQSMEKIRQSQIPCLLQTNQSTENSTHHAIGKNNSILVAE